MSNLLANSMRFVVVGFLFIIALFLSVIPVQAEQNTHDYTNMPIKDGNFIWVRVPTTYGEESSIKVYLEQGKEYFYTVRYAGQAFEIISPNGRIVKDYPEHGNNRKNLSVASFIQADETGVYTFHVGEADGMSYDFALYECVDDISSIRTLKINDGVEGQSQRKRAYVVKADKYSPYVIDATVSASTSIGFDIYAFHRENADSPSHIDAYSSEWFVFDSFDVKNHETYVVYNENEDVYANLIQWSNNVNDSYAEIEINARRFTLKTGDEAKEKVKELNAEHRGLSFVADPVDVFAGNFVDNRTLLSYSGNNPLSFTLSYDSIANDSKSLGGGFTHNFETYLTETENGLDLYWTPNSVVRFTKEGSIFKPVNANQLGIDVVKTDSGYTVTDKNKQVYVFNSSGKLVSFTDRVGLVTTYSYSDGLLTNVVNSKGQSFDFSYDNSKLVKVVDKTGRSLSFAYKDGRLSQVITPKGYALNIEYTASNLQNYKVSKMTYDGVTLVENQYDKHGRVSVQYDGNRTRTEFTYDEYTDDNFVTTTVTTGDRKEILVHDKDGNLLSKTDGEGFTEKYSYDSNRNMISRTDKNGHVYHYEYDNLNRLIKEINPNETFKTYEYDSYNNITKITTEDGLLVTSEYDGGKLISMTDKSGRKTLYDYDSFGNPVNIKRDSFEVTNTYDDNGYLVSTTTGGKTAQFENDALGRVVTTILPNKQTTSVEYDADNNIVSTTDIAGYTTTSKYNAFGNVTTFTNEKGVVTTYAYDNNGNLLSQKTGDRETVYTYNEFNELTSQYDKSGTRTKNKETFTYNKRGELLSYKDADNKGYSLTYDGNGNVLTRTVGNSVEKYEYDNMNRRVAYTDGNGYKTTYEYDVVGNLKKEISPSGAVQSYTYDSMNRLLEWVDGEGHKTSYTYDTRGNLIKEVQPNGAITEYEYNADNQQTAVINALGERSESRYNSLGQLVEVTNALGETVLKYDYNSLGKVSKITDGNGHTNELSYDAKGNLLEVTDALGHVIESNQYNQFDELVESLDALNNKNVIEYDAYGNISKTIDSKGNATTYSYSNASRLTETTDVYGLNMGHDYDSFGNISRLGGRYSNNTLYKRDANQNIIEETFYFDTIKYAYDNENRLTKKTNGRRQDISYEYDKNGRVTKETAPEGATTFTYDSVGNMLSAVSDTDSIERTYDLLGRVTSKTQNGKTIEYDYDKRGHLVKITYPDGKEVDYTYDVMGNLLKVVDWNGKVTAYEYNANNQLVKTTHSNGTVELRDYDKKGQLISLQNIKGSDVISSYSYEYDANGNIVKENDIVYEYDKLNRLVRAGDNTYSYSDYGNITSFTVLKDGLSYKQDMQYGNNNELTRLNGFRTTVDEDGNLIKYKLNNKEYIGTYDSKNRLISFDGVTYRYDSENNRIGLNDTSFVVDNDSDKYSRVLTEETNGDVTYYVYGHGLIGAYRSGEFETNHYDYRGSLTSVTDEDGNVIGNVSYDEYGVVLEKDESIQSRFLYNGKYGVQTDSNGLYYMRARYYNPDLKRFMNRDVVSGNIIESQTLNRYAFVNGNPISYHDPFGLAREAIANSKASLMDMLHIGLDIAGMLPVIGEVADGLNAVLYLSKGDYTNALLSGMAMIPVVGNASTVAKYADDVAFLGKKGYNEVVGLSNSKPVIHNKPVAGDNVGVNLRGRSGYINYGELDSLGRATKAEAYITKDMIGTGSKTRSYITPEGFVQGKKPPHHRGHIIAKDLGGSGTDLRNLTPLESYANTPVMRKHEQEVKRAVMKGENILYTSEPIYDGVNLIPKGVTITAKGDKGFIKGVTILNRGRY